MSQQEVSDYLKKHNKWFDCKELSEIFNKDVSQNLRKLRKDPEIYFKQVKHIHGFKYIYKSRKWF